MSSIDSSSNVGLNDIATSSASSSQTTKLTNWRNKIEISIAKSRKVRGGNYVQIATVDRNTMEPKCRTVVFRGFLPSLDGNQSCQMKMITDARSNKYAEITGGGGVNENENENKINCEMVWWFSKSSEQYRISGQLQFIGETESDAHLLSCRKQQWGNLTDMAREQFYWLEPGIPYERESEVPVGGRDEEGKVLSPPSNFLLMILNPKKCDYLKLGDNFRQLDTLEGEEWKVDRVNP
jgi:PPOX class probable FMN-dependent enzyme